MTAGQSISLYLCAVASIMLAACGGGSANMQASPPPCPLTAGGFPVPAPPDLLYPMNGANGVPDGNFTLVVGYGTSTPPPAQLVPANGGTTVQGGTWGPAPSPIPSPAATPRFSSETLYGAQISALAPHVNYTVQVTVGTPPCQSTETAGSFTTQ